MANNFNWNIFLNYMRGCLSDINYCLQNFPEHNTGSWDYDLNKPYNWIHHRYIVGYNSALIKMIKDTPTFAENIVDTCLCTYLMDVNKKIFESEFENLVRFAAKLIAAPALKFMA